MKSFSHPPERTNFPPKEIIPYTYPKTINFSNEKTFQTRLKESIFQPKKKNSST